MTCLSLIQTFQFFLLLNIGLGSSIAFATAAAPASAGGDGACTAKMKTAQMICSPLELATGNAEGAAMLEMVLQQGGSTLYSALSAGGNMQDSCKKAADVSMLMGALNGARGAACKTALNMCVTACTAEKGATASKVFSVNKAKCQKYNMNFAMMLMQMMSFAQNFAQNKMCEDSLSNQPTGDPNLALNLAPPNALAPPGAADCSAAGNAQKPECLCILNPRAPTCSNGLNSGGPGGLASGLRNGDAGGGSGAGSGDDTDGLGGPGGFPVGAAKNGGGSGGGAAGGGGSGFGSNGSGSGEGPEKDKSAQGGSNPPASSTWGFGGGGGGGSFNYGKSAPGSSPNSAQAALKAIQDQFKLKLGKPEREPANSVVASANDGVTPANGITLWDKISKQYSKQKEGLLTP